MILSKLSINSSVDLLFVYVRPRVSRVRRKLAYHSLCQLGHRVAVSQTPYPASQRTLDGSAEQVASTIMGGDAESISLSSCRFDCQHRITYFKRHRSASFSVLSCAQRGDACAVRMQFSEERKDGRGPLVSLDWSPLSYAACYGRDVSVLSAT